MTDMNTETPPPSMQQIHTAQAKGFLALFFDFDKLIGDTLIKVVYYIGLAFIALGVVISILGSFAMMGYNPAMGLGTILVSLVGGVVGVIVWRFATELWIILFRIYFRLGEIRDRLK